MRRPVRRHACEVDLLQGRPFDRQQDLACHIVTQVVQFAHPRLQVARLGSVGQPLPCSTVGDSGDGDDVVGQAGTVSVVGVLQKSRVIPLSQRRHPTLAVGRLEVVLACTDDLVGLVKKQHGGSSRWVRRRPLSARQVDGG